MTLIEAHIGERLDKKYSKFRDFEIMSILSDEVRSILNMVPANKEQMKDLSFDPNEFDPF